MNSSVISSGSKKLSVTDSFQNSPLSVLSKAIKHSNIIFMGTFVDRRYVKYLAIYRDIVVVENDEQELYDCLAEIKKVAEEHYGHSKWLGFTCDMRDSVIQCYNLWVELDGIPLGKHWFQLKSIKIKDKSIQLQIKHLRSVEQSRERRSFGIEECIDIHYQKILTYENICGFFKFLALFAMSIFALTGNALWYISDYSIKMVHEFSGLVQACTPVVIEAMNCVTRCVGGLFWLIYMFWRRDTLPPNQTRLLPVDNHRRNNGATKCISYRQ